jgi:ADP-ribosylation factor GTPase-activating protein 2/3
VPLPDQKCKLGLGAIKTRPVDFAEAETIKQLGCDRECEEAEARKTAEEAKATSLELPVVSGFTPANSSSCSSAAKAKTEVDGAAAAIEAATKSSS